MRGDKGPISTRQGPFRARHRAGSVESRGRRLCRIPRAHLPFLLQRDLRLCPRSRAGARVPRAPTRRGGVRRVCGTRSTDRRTSSRLGVGFDSFGLPERWGYSRRARCGLRAISPRGRTCQLSEGWFADTLPGFGRGEAFMALLHVTATSTARRGGPLGSPGSHRTRRSRPRPTSDRVQGLDAGSVRVPPRHRKTVSGRLGYASAPHHLQMARLGHARHRRA